MSTEVAGLGFSSNSPVRKAVPSEIICRSKRSSWLRFELMLLPMILLAGIFSASKSAFRTRQTAPILDGQALSDSREFLFALDFQRFEGNTGVLAVCLFAAAGFGCARFVLINSRQGRKPQTRRPLPFVRAPFSSFWRAQEDQRKHLSRELHDSVGQTLTAVGLQLRALQSTALTPDQRRMLLDETCQLNTEALRLVRDLAMGLRPALLDDVSLVTALEWQARQFSRHTGISAFLEADEDFEDLSEAHRTCIYRCVQEALTNCGKHAQAKNVRIVVSASAGAVNVTVEDDGIGFDLGKPSRTGLGLLGMRERVAEVNGKLSLVSRQHGGTALNLEIPVSGGVLA
jgi:signal transduction histidine kinase